VSLVGRVWLVGDRLSAHDMVPGRYDPLIMAHRWDEVREHVLEDRLPGWAEAVRQGDVLVGGIAMGAGKHHFAILEMLRRMGVVGYLAESFSPLFQRACIDLGIPAVAFHHQRLLSDGDVVELDIATGRGRNRSTGVAFAEPPVSALLEEIVDAGGWPAYVVSRLRG